MPIIDLNKNILLIESDPDIAITIINWIKDYAVVTRVSSEADILTMIKTQNWDLIITDSRLPDLNDLDITKIAKSVDTLLPVLIITEDKKINFIIKALEYHADGFLFKPLEKEKFLPLALKLMEEYQLNRAKQSKVILAIGAHPDDVEVGCGGALARLRSRGDTVHILTLSLGEAGGNPTERRSEAERAAKIQGAILHLAKCSDTKISEGISTIKIIEDIVQEVKPTHVFTHSFHDNHNDHRNVHQASVCACREIQNFYCYQSPSTTIFFEPNLFIDISGEFLEKKLEAIAVFKSQCQIRPYLKEDLIRATARYWGRFSNYTLVEPMETVRQKV